MKRLPVYTAIFLFVAGFGMALIAGIDALTCEPTTVVIHDSDCTLCALDLPRSDAPRPAVRVYFAPGGDPERAIVGLIDGARSTVRLMAYDFTSRPIAGALDDAVARGVDVECVVDRGMPRERNGALPLLLKGGVPVFVDGHHPIMHDKVCIVDGARVAFGSYNYTASAWRNAENLAVVPDAALAAAYRAHYDEHRAHSVPAHSAAAVRFAR